MSYGSEQRQSEHSSQATASRQALLTGAAIAAGLLLVLLVLAPAWQERGSDYSLAVRAQVVASGDGFAYRYIHEGRVHLGWRYDRRGSSHRATRHLRTGDWIAIRIDPEHPERSLMHTGLKISDRLTLFLGVFLLLGGILPGLVQSCLVHYKREHAS